MCVCGCAHPRDAVVAEIGGDTRVVIDRNASKRCYKLVRVNPNPNPN